MVHEGIDIFAEPAEGLLDALRVRTAIVEVDEEDGSAFLAPDLRLSFWRPPAPIAPDDIDDGFFWAVRLAGRA